MLIILILVFTYINLVFFTYGLLCGFYRSFNKASKELLDCILWPFMLWQFLKYYREMRRRIDFVNFCKMVIENGAKVDEQNKRANL